MKNNLPITMHNHTNEVTTQKQTRTFELIGQIAKFAMQLPSILKVLLFFLRHVCGTGWSFERRINTRLTREKWLHF